MNKRRKGIYPTGDQHPRFSGGKRITEKGYVRFTSGRNMGMREHRVVIEELMLADRLREITTAFADAVIATVRNPPRLRPDQDVHHMDWQRAHNCPQNLLVLDEAIHHAISRSNQYTKTARGVGAGNLRPEPAVSTGTDAPDWVTS